MDRPTLLALCLHSDYQAMLTHLASCGHMHRSMVADLVSEAGIGQDSPPPSAMTSEHGQGERARQQGPGISAALGAVLHLRSWAGRSC